MYSNSQNWRSLSQCCDYSVRQTLLKRCLTRIFRSEVGYWTVSHLVDIYTNNLAHMPDISLVMKLIHNWQIESGVDFPLFLGPAQLLGQTSWYESVIWKALKKQKFCLYQLVKCVCLTWVPDASKTIEAGLLLAISIPCWVVTFHFTWNPM